MSRRRGAAAVARAGTPRRLLGVVVAAAGAYVGVAVVRLLLAPPAPADLAVLPGAPAGGTAIAGAAALQPGPLPAALGAGLCVGAARAPGRATLLRAPPPRTRDRAPSHAAPRASRSGR